MKRDNRHAINNQNLAGLLMLAPGLSAIITYLIFEHSLRPVGWQLGKTGLSFTTAWLRLKTGSMWSAAILHGSHNALMLNLFNPLTTYSGGAWPCWANTGRYRPS